MIISFKPQFVTPILNGTKIHTIREDKHNRWKPGKLMHMATGVRTKNYNCFCKTYLVNVKKISIKWQGTTITIKIDDSIKVNFNTATNWSNHSNNGYDFLLQLAKNDGFEGIEDFIQWFNTDFEGKILQWIGFNLLKQTT